MAQIIKQRERKVYKRVELNFYTKETDEVCYGFPVVNGDVIPCNYVTHEPCSEEECNWWNNYLFAKANDSLYSVMEEKEYYYTEPAVAICECGEEITLNYDAEECEHCGRMHNMFGQELRPRKYWYWDGI